MDIKVWLIMDILLGIILWKAFLSSETKRRNNVWLESSQKSTSEDQRGTFA